MPTDALCSCGNPLEEMDYRIVPQIELVYWAKNGLPEALDKGWFWCAECNLWTHQPSLDMYAELARQH